MRAAIPPGRAQAKIRKPGQAWFLQKEKFDLLMKSIRPYPVEKQKLLYTARPADS